MKFKKGDNVKVVKGNDIGKTGEILSVYPGNNKLLIKGIRVVKKHLKATKTSPHGGIADKTLPISASNVRLICPSCAKAVRIKYKIDKENKMRICHRCHKNV